MATSRAIRQNVFLAFAYNVVCVPLAAFGLVTPMWASATMSLSSVSVIANSLRLRQTNDAAVLAPSRLALVERQARCEV